MYSLNIQLIWGRKCLYLAMNYLNIIVPVSIPFAISATAYLFGHTFHVINSVWSLGFCIRHIVFYASFIRSQITIPMEKSKCVFKKQLSCIITLLFMLCDLFLDWNPVGFQISICVEFGCYADDFVMPPFEEGVAHVGRYVGMSVGMSVCRSVGMSVSLNLVQLITQQHFAPETSTLVGR